MAQLLRRARPWRRLPLGLAERASPASLARDHYSDLLPPLLPQRRWASSPAADQEVLRILKSEIEHERATEAVSQKEAKQPPKPFTIVDKPGAQEVFLHRSYNNEDISISCLFEVQPYPLPEEEKEGDTEEEKEGDIEEAPSQMVQMSVKIAKGGDDPYLEIRCVTHGDDPVIEHVVYKEVAIRAKDLPYEGPQFEDLDLAVQKGFNKFLKARGIDRHLGDFLINYMYHKEQREYSSWLRNVEAFLLK